jgi:hypothetical protein
VGHYISCQVGFSNYCQAFKNRVFSYKITSERFGVSLTTCTRWRIFKSFVRFVHFQDCFGEFPTRKLDVVSRFMSGIFKSNTAIFVRTIIGNFHPCNVIKVVAPGCWLLARQFISPSRNYWWFTPGQLQIPLQIASASVSTKALVVMKSNYFQPLRSYSHSFPPRKSIFLNRR